MPTLEVLRLVLLVAHFVGMAAVIGPFITQHRLRAGFDLAPMLVGAIVQVVTGNGLVATSRLQAMPVSDPKMVVKMAVAVLVLALLLVAVLRARRRGSADRPDPLARPLFRTAGVLAVLNVTVAAVWR